MHSSQQNTITQEYSIRVPKNTIKRYNVMIFSATLGVDFSKWSTVKMERQNNMKEYKGVEEETPKFGAGSEFGKEAREEARRKKLGIVSRKYKPEDQPWILKVGGSAAKKFKGIREGGVSENASYYVFTHSLDGAIDAYPLNEWYRFQPIQRYKALSAEEAEQEFGKRNKVLNYFSLMLRKRLKGDEFTEAEDAEEKNKKDSTKKYKDLKISDMEEWMDTSDESSSEEDQKDDDKEEKKKNKKVQKKNKPKRDTDMEAFEDSDDGDNEGRELDYISDSSESEPEQNKELKGVAEEKALRKLLTSDEDSEEEENKSDKEQSNAEEEDKDGNKEEKDTDKKKSNKKKQKKKEASKKKKDILDNDDSSDFSSDSTDSDTDSKKKTKKEDDKEKERDREKDKECNSASSSRSASPLHSAAQKRKLPTLTETITKKPKFENSISNYIPGSIESGITEDAVRRYLMRKPMTTTELLQKFKSKKTGLSSEQLVNIMTQILKKINPVKQIIKGKMYLSIKA